jgi:hypothetical protein
MDNQRMITVGANNLNEHEKCIKNSNHIVKNVDKKRKT